MPEPKEKEAPQPLKASVVVVSCNRIELLRRCLTALELSEAREQMEIIVVDNGSTDGSAQLEDEFRGATFIRIPRNFGLTKAMNLGLRAAQGSYVLFLHEDTEISPDTVRELAAKLDAEDVDELLVGGNEGGVAVERLPQGGLGTAEPAATALDPRPQE